MRTAVTIIVDADVQVLLGPARRSGAPFERFVNHAKRGGCERDDGLRFERPGR